MQWRSLGSEGLVIERAPPPRHGITRCRGHWSIAQFGRAPRPHRGRRRFDPVWTNPAFTYKKGSYIGRGHRLENGTLSRRRVGMSVRLALPPPSRRGTQVRLKGPGCYPGRSAQVRRREGPNPFLSSTAAWRKMVARRAVNSSGPGSNPGAAAVMACSSAAERPRDMGEIDRFDPVQANRENLRPAP